MTDWARLVAGDFAVPADLSAAVGELTDMLAAADPAVRDDLAYPILITWIRRGVLDDRLPGLGDTMVSRLAHPEIQARTFAPLILAAAVNRDTAAGVLGATTGPSGEQEAVPHRWFEPFAAWWVAEPDIRGWDDKLGWLHAVAHGADLAGAFGVSPRITGADVLAVIARRVVAPTGYQYAQMEEDRVARAIVRVLGRPGLTSEAATGWLAVVDDLFATGGPGSLPIPVANTLAVLRATYAMADRAPTPHARVVTDAIAARLHQVFPAYAESRPDPDGPAG
jgi:hypothetical protein